MRQNRFRVSGEAELRKARGAFFTPIEICKYIASWAIRSDDDLVLEPSCGEAAFLVAAAHRLAELGGRPSEILQLHGIDLHRESVAVARRAAFEAGAKTKLCVGDFFDSVFAERYDAIVGNPPYVRYQGVTGEARTKARAAALAEGVTLTALANSWAAFVVRAASLLKPEGRLGLVLPAELLTVNYAAPVRSFLLRRFARVRLVLFEERVFPGVIEEVVLLLAEGSGGVDHFEVFQVRNLDDLNGSTAVATRWSPTADGDKWVSALLPAGASSLYESIIGNSDRFVPLLEWGDPTLGMVTGNNDFFTLTAEQVDALGLERHELLRISPPGSRHLRGLAFDAVDWRRLRNAGKSVYLFRPRSNEPSEAAARYIARGQRAKVHAAFKCRMRKPWWRVPLVAVPDLFLTYMNSDAPRIVANGARAHYLNSIHGIVLRDELRAVGSDLLPIGFLNSVTLVGAEIVGRSYGGGILKLEPKEADVLPVPSPILLASAESTLSEVRNEVSALLADRRLSEVVRLIDEALLVEHAGMDANDLQSLEAARGALHSRRVSRHRR